MQDQLELEDLMLDSRLSACVRRRVAWGMSTVRWTKQLGELEKRLERSRYAAAVMTESARAW